MKHWMGSAQCQNTILRMATGDQETHIRVARAVKAKGEMRRFKKGPLLGLYDSAPISRSKPAGRSRSTSYGGLPNDGAISQARRPGHCNDDVAVDWFAVREAIVAAWIASSQGLLAMTRKQLYFMGCISSQVLRTRSLPVTRSSW
jgi:hypothetical protein